MIIIAGTGHRPNKLGGYGDVAEERLSQFALTELRALQPDVLISGMALGWDQAIANAALTLGIPLHCYVPFEGHPNLWPPRSQRRYARILSRAALVRVCSPGGFMPTKMQFRNRCMVDDCTMLLALWNGSDGGTANCVAYARSVGRLQVNCWERFYAGRSHE